MKNLIFILIFAPLSLFSAPSIVDPYEDIANAIRSGDARSVSRYFSNSVDLTLIGQEDVYSKAQAEQILKDFFNKNTPRSFSIIHRGESKDGAKYAIGNLTTSSGNYRVYYYFKVAGGSVNIQELRFMKE
ncbi:MAG: DUF4783 domain-containing protein [Bacteroidota bacterium]|jgi:hypothetical protein